MQQITLALVGLKPMLQHNGRLANPLDGYTRALKTISGRRRKTDSDIVEMMQIEARGSAYETEDGLLGIPTAAVWRCIQQAATAFKLGKDIERGLLADDVVEPITINGQTWSVDKYLEREDAIDFRSVRISSSRTMRARVRVPRDWSSTHTMELDEEVIDLRNLQPVFERAGRYIGLGDWRPRFGTFALEIVTS